ncbi:DUF4189 domain-containing protein [Lysobacter sp. CA199]|uniref:DUF4189 domain-containing protein n=1 Tax=Lysobacter sp. CA199 TaxID=3455608 RepID=UPI003F8D3CBF
MKNSFCLNLALISLAVLCFSGEATACPAGMIANPIGAGGQAECVPGVNHQNWGRGSGSGTISYYDGYGAFSFDAENVKVGVSDPLDSFGSKGQAKRSAMKSCKQNGGKKCKVIDTFMNQCAVTLLGATDSGGGTLAIYVGKGKEVADAKKDAEAQCKTSGSPICQPAYADCVSPWSR